MNFHLGHPNSSSGSNFHKWHLLRPSDVSLNKCQQNCSMHDWAIVIHLFLLLLHLKGTTFLRVGGPICRKFGEMVAQPPTICMDKVCFVVPKSGTSSKCTVIRIISLPCKNPLEVPVCCMSKFYVWGYTL